MRAVKIIAMILFYLFLAASVFSIAYSIYWFKYQKRTTVTSVNLDTLSYVDGEKYAWEVFVATNENKNGAAIFEMRINYYTDANVPGEGETKNYYSSGLQLVNDFSFKYHVENPKPLKSITYAEPKNPIYYNTTSQDVSYVAINELEPDDVWILDFAGTLGLIESKGPIKSTDSWLADINLNHDINLFFRDIIDSVSSLEDGTQVLVFDLSEYFKGKIWNKDENFKDMQNSDYNFMFANIKVTKTSNGIVNANQSLFGCVDSDPNWQYEGIEKSDFYKSETNIYLTEKDLFFQDVEGTVNNKLGYLKPKAIEMYGIDKTLNISLNINLDSEYLLNNSVILNGIRDGGLGDLNISSITITSSTQRDFYLVTECKNINLTNVTLIGGANE